MWSEGEINGYKYYVKHYENASEYGINEGRISKMEIRKNGKSLYNFDRGLDYDRLDSEGKKVYAQILKQYN